MAIRISGMYSGLDTESLINELASAQSYKKNSLVKAQTKLSWKQDAWKALNTKIYSFYTNTLSNMRFESSYSKKSTKISNANAISVATSDSAMNGVQTVQVNHLAKAGYLTGGDLTTADGVCFTGAASLKQLGFTGSGSFDVVGANGQKVNIRVDENTTINGVVDKIKATGLNANYDQANQRIFISSKSTGAEAGFSFVGNDEQGMKALASLGLLSLKDIQGGEYAKWAGYATDTDAYTKVIDAEVAKRAAAYKAENEALTKQNEEIAKINDKIVEANAELLAELQQDANYEASETKDSLYDVLYGVEQDSGEVDDDGNPIMKRVGGLEKALEDAKTALEDLKKDTNATTEQLENAQKAVDDAKAEFDAVYSRYDKLKTIAYNEECIANNEGVISDNNDKIADNQNYFTVDADSGEVSGTEALKNDVKAELDAKVDLAVEATTTDKYSQMAKATKVEAQDAEILLNGTRFTSYNNTFTVNGLTLTALEETTSEVTLTTSEDTDGIYKMIKNFFSEYNKLINEMDSLYNAESSKGYDPLLAEEKEAMAESEVEEWEKKIKDSLLRRDSTLSSVSSAMSTVLMQSININGKSMSLSDFGINTLGYFKAAENERNAYHIDGDADDAAVSGNANVLKGMIASDPDAVTSFFSQLSKNLYDTLTNKMSTSDVSSAFTVYNDKQMKSDYDDYTEKIEKQEEKLNALIDKWYDKFSAMETALSKLESKNNSIASLFGG